MLMDEREGVLGGPCHLVTAALCWTLKVRAQMSRQEGRAGATASAWIPWMMNCPLQTGALTSGCRASGDRSQQCCPGLVTGASARLRRMCGCVHTKRTGVCVCVCVHACTFLQAWCHAYRSV